MVHSDVHLNGPLRFYRIWYNQLLNHCSPLLTLESFCKFSLNVAGFLPVIKTQNGANGMTLEYIAKVTDDSEHVLLP